MTIRNCMTCLHVRDIQENVHVRCAKNLERGEDFYTRWPEALAGECNPDEYERATCLAMDMSVCDWATRTTRRCAACPAHRADKVEAVIESSPNHDGQRFRVGDTVEVVGGLERTPEEVGPFTRGQVLKVVNVRSGQDVFVEPDPQAPCSREPKRFRLVSRPGDVVVNGKPGLILDAVPSDSKDTNPKDAIGASKLPLHLVPGTAIAMASVAHLNGALKYGAWNWRKAGVRASVYLDALKRHIEKWENGEEVDEERVPHLSSMLACLSIIIDARACGKLTDDRPPSVDVAGFIADLTPHVARLKELHAGKAPHHFTIEDSEVTL